MSKVYHRDIPRILEKHYITDRNIHDYATRQTDYIHIAYADTNWRNVTMRYHGGKVRNSIIENKIPYNDSINAFKRYYKSF